MKAQAKWEQPEWVFGYGSLMWRPSFDYEERCVGSVEHWQRRFWQGSTDHRGVPGAPGRVVTLARDDGAVCYGVAYRIAHADSAEILAELDYREKGGYVREHLCVEFRDGRSVCALTYIGTPDNPDYLGPDDDHRIAQQIAESVGPSGSNRDYLVRLHEELITLGIHDPHVIRLHGLMPAR